MAKCSILARLRAKTRVRTILIHKLLFADDATLVSHTADRDSGATQQVLTCLQRIWPYDQYQKDQGHGHQDVDNPPNVTIDGTPLDVINSLSHT